MDFAFGTPIQQKRYLFIDGEYLRKVMREMGEEWFQDAATFDPVKLGGGYEKVLYYDCGPAQAKDETEAEFEVRLKEREDYFNSLRRLDGWHVIEGTAKYQGRSKKPSQKEVDVQLAVDMLQHTYRRNVQRIGFVAGDLDFRPLVRAVVQEGMYVELIFRPKSTSSDLQNAVDSWTIIDLHRFHAMTSDAYMINYPLPSLMHANANAYEGQAANQIAMVGTRRIANLYFSSQRGRDEVIMSVEPLANGKHIHTTFSRDKRDFHKRVALEVMAERDPLIQWKDGPGGQHEYW